MIQADDLRRSFRPRGAPVVRALDGASLEVAAGRVMALVGGNGSGKTTLLRVLAGVLRPDSGRALILGRDPAARASAVRARIGLLTEEPCLPGRLTALWHVALHASLCGVSRREALVRARRLLEEIGAGPFLDVRMDLLSKGNRTKVAIARALVHAPAALLLDEPTSGLDRGAALRVKEMIAARAAGGCSVLLVTHDVAVAAVLCHSLAIMRAGRIVAIGSPGEFRAAASDAARPLASLDQACLDPQRGAP